MKPLSGRVALVTGGGGRLGPIWRDALLKAGAVVAQVDRGDMDTTTAGLSFPGMDIANPYHMEQVCHVVRRDLGPVSILVNNAGVDSRPTFTDPDHMYADMVRVNILGTDIVTRWCRDDMLIAGGGSIINIASLYGLVAPDFRYYSHRSDGWVKDPIYGATKAAIISLTKYYAAAYAKDGIRVNALAPGGVVAPGDSLTAQDPQFVEKYTSRIPMGRMCHPDDLAGPLVFLASDASSFLTGQCLALDGGYLCW